MKKISGRGTRLIIIIGTIIALLGLGAYFFFIDPIFADDKATTEVSDPSALQAEIEKLEQDQKNIYDLAVESCEKLSIETGKSYSEINSYYLSGGEELDKFVSEFLHDQKNADMATVVGELLVARENQSVVEADLLTKRSLLSTIIETRASADGQENKKNTKEILDNLKNASEEIKKELENDQVDVSVEFEKGLSAGIKGLAEKSNGAYSKLLTNLGLSTLEADNKTDAQLLVDLKKITTLESTDPEFIDLASKAQTLIDYWENFQALKKIEDLKSTVSHYGPKGAVIDQLTGRVQFRSPILVEQKDSSGNVLKDEKGGIRTKEIGYALFDPVKKTYSGALTVDDFNGQRVSLVADQLTKDVYLEYGGGAGDEKIVGDDKLGLVSVRVGENGGIGGSFTVSNRLFIYNPNTKAFQIPISLDSTVKGAGFSGDDVGSIGKNTIFLGTDGSVTGRVGDVGKFKDGDIAGSGALYLAQDGTVTYGMSFTDGGLPLGGISINSDGDIAGTVNLAKMVDLPLNISFGSGGITGVSFDLGGGATKIPISIGKNGQLAFSLATFNIGSLIPGLNLSGILSSLLKMPILNIAQDAHGNFRLYFLFGSMKLFGHENRPLMPPEIEMDEAGNYKTECIYFRHSFKKALMTVRVYQSPCTKIEADEQKLRSAMIFEVYNRLLGRNPSTQEWANWYFYSGHQLYQWPKHEKDKQYRMDGTKLQLEKAIMGTAYYKGINSADKLDNLKEYRWIKAGKNPLQAPTRPTDLMTADPFAGSTDGDNGVEEVDKERIAKWISEGFDKFFEGIEADAATDEDMEVPTEDEISVNVPTGFSFFAVPSNIAYIDPQSFTEKGVNVFRYEGDEKKWVSAVDGGEIGTMRSVFGYYLYNSGSEKTVIAYQPEDIEEQSLSTITKGWNLLANSSQGTITIGGVKFLNPSDSTKVSLISLAQQNKVYSGTYLISDPTAATAEEAFTKVDLLSDGAENNTIGSLGGYWVYLY